MIGWDFVDKVQRSTCFSQGMLRCSRPENNASTRVNALLEGVSTDVQLWLELYDNLQDITKETMTLPGGVGVSKPELDIAEAGRRLRKPRSSVHG